MICLSEPDHANFNFFLEWPCAHGAAALRHGAGIHGSAAAQRRLQLRIFIITGRDAPLHSKQGRFHAEPAL